MKLEQCLEKLSPKDQKRLKENYKLENNSTLEDLASEIISSLPEEIFILTDEEIDTLKSLDKRKEVSNELLQKGYIYKEDNQYILPEEINLIIKELLTKELLNERLLLAVSFYLKANGAIKITDLVRLIKESGINTTKEKIKSLIKDEDIIKNNMIYYNEVAQELEQTIHLVEKVSGNYKVFNLKEIPDLLYLKEEYFPKKIDKILEKKVKEKTKRNFLSMTMVEVAMIGIMDEEEIIESITKGEVKLLAKEKEKILDILEEVTDILPTWIDGGSSFLEDIDAEEERKEKIEEYSKTRKDMNIMEIMNDIYRYILTYVTINGVMELDKLTEILQTNHGLDITKENILTLLEDDDYIKVTKNYLNIMDNDLDTIKELMKIKNNFSNYKIIEDAEKTLEEFDNHYDKIEEILKEYQIEGEACDTILSLFLIREISQEELSMILDCFPIKLSSKLIKELSERLKNERKEMPTWEHNGFKSVELSQNKTAKKIGRNDKCPCKSGRKYKVCCDK